MMCPQVLMAQGFLEQFSYEGLRFSGIGFEFGGVLSDRLTREVTGAVRIDCGRIAPNVRVLFGVSYFEGQFNETEIREFALGIQQVVDPGSSSRCFLLHRTLQHWSQQARCSTCVRASYAPR